MSYKTPPLGRIDDESNLDYHRTDETYGCRVLSNSRLQTFRERPLLYKKKYVSKEIVEKFEAEHFLVGHSSHVLILEGEEKYLAEHLVAPAINKRTKAGKLEWEALLARCEDENLTLLTQEQDTTNRALKRSVDANELATKLLSESVPEVSFRVNWGYFFAQVRTDGFIESCSAQLAQNLTDWGLNYNGNGVNKGDSIILDYKTCATLSEQKHGCFQRHIYDLGYCYQEQLYRQIVSEVQGRPVNHFLFIASEKCEPFETVVINIPDEDKQLALQVLKVDLENLYNCYKGNRPWAMHQGVIQSGFNNWQRRELESRLVGLGQSIERNVA